MTHDAVHHTGTPAAGDLVFRTALTLIEPDRYYFRGVDATELARHHGYEVVAEWIWTGEFRPETRFTASAESLAAARLTAASLPRHSSSTDRLRAAVAAAAASDPLRFDLSAEGVLISARSLIPTLVGALPAAGASDDVGEGDGSLAARLWPKLSARPADAASLTVLDTALALLADHDLAPRRWRPASPRRPTHTRTPSSPRDWVCWRDRCTAPRAGRRTACCPRSWTG